jgi:hypothetical protein
VLSLVLTAALAQAGAPPPPSTADAPSAVRLLFQAGDLRRAVGMAKTCAGSKKKGAKECAAMVKPLVEYQSIINKTTALTAGDARALLEHQQKISPLVPSKLSAEAQDRFVDRPWGQAQAAGRAGDEKLALELARAVLDVAPSHAGALALVGPPDAGVGKPPATRRADAGTPRDGGEMRTAP